MCEVFQVVEAGGGEGVRGPGQQVRDRAVQREGEGAGPVRSGRQPGRVEQVCVCSEVRRADGVQQCGQPGPPRRLGLELEIGQYARPAGPGHVRQQLDRLGGTQIAYGQRLTDPDGLEADLVVGADGINSAVRTARFGTASGPRPVGTVAWIGIAGYETGVYGETGGAGRFFGMTPVEPGRTNWYATVPETAAAAAATPEAAAEQLRAAFAGWHDPIPQVLADTDPATWIRYELRHLHPALPTFVDGGRTALVGARPTP